MVWDLGGEDSTRALKKGFFRVSFLYPGRQLAWKKNQKYSYAAILTLSNIQAKNNQPAARPVNRRTLKAKQNVKTPDT